MCRHYIGRGTTRRERRKAVVNIGHAKPAKNTRADAPEWIIVDFEGRGFRCERCGATERHSTPKGVSRLDAFALRGQAFAIDHADCEEAHP